MKAPDEGGEGRIGEMFRPATKPGVKARGVGERKRPRSKRSSMEAAAANTAMTSMPGGDNFAARILRSVVRSRHEGSEGHRSRFMRREWGHADPVKRHRRQKQVSWPKQILLAQDRLRLNWKTIPQAGKAKELGGIGMGGARSTALWMYGLFRVSPKIGIIGINMA